MFTFVFDDELFKFQFEIPAFDLLFQLPPKWASTHPIPLLGDASPPTGIWGVCLPTSVVTGTIPLMQGFSIGT